MNYGKGRDDMPHELKPLKNTHVFQRDVDIDILWQNRPKDLVVYNMSSTMYREVYRYNIEGISWSNIKKATFTFNLDDATPHVCGHKLDWI